MRAWQYSTTKGGLEKNLQINASATVPKPKSEQHLVKIIATALNPVDYKPAEVALVSRLAISKPATPGIDFVGTVVTPAPGSHLKAGQLLFGMAGSSPIAGGSLAEFNICKVKNAIALPDGVDPIDAASVGTAGVTAYQSIVPRIREGDKVFINGGSGGTGIWGIQIAKAKGCHVTTSCSTKNVELCKNLGADRVLDYKKESVLEALKGSGHKFDHAVDNVGSDKQLIWNCHQFMQPGAAYVMVGGAPTLGDLADNIKRKVLPGFLGGLKGKVEGFWPVPKPEDLQQIGEWMQSGRIRTVIDQRFPFDQAPQAFEKLKTGRAVGKIVIDVASET